MRRYGSASVGVGEKDRIAESQHDVVGARPAFDGLVKVIADRIIVGE